METTGSLFLSLNFENGALPTTVELVPAGSPILGRDGRKWKNGNPRKVALNSMARLSRLVIDENHSTDLSAPKGGASPAMGWMTNLRAEADGSMRADVEWTKRGAKAVLNREYSFISPVFLHDDRGEITAVLRAALTNSPNLDLPALNSETKFFENNANTDTEESMKKELCAALGLPETATEAEVLAAAKALNAAGQGTPRAQTDAARVDLTAYAPRADLNAMETRAVTAEKQIAELNAARLKAEAEAAVDGAVRARKIAPASREEYLALCATEDGLEKMKNIFSKSPEIIGTETQAPEGAPPPAGETAALNAEEASLAKAMGYTAEEYRDIKGGKK